MTADLQEVRIDGQRVAADSAAVPVLERALHYGDALFETIACLADKTKARVVSSPASR